MKTKSFKLALLLFILPLFFISCSKEQNEGPTPELLADAKVDMESSFAVPIDSEGWNITDNTYNRDFEYIYNAYLVEKNQHESQNCYENLLAMWHTNLLGYVDQMNALQAITILNDMDALKMNVASFDTYYSICNSFYKEEVKIDSERLQNFYKKNKLYLESANWKNEELKKLKLSNLNKTHFVLQLP
jgi:hypothetical protein